MKKQIYWSRIINFRDNSDDTEMEFDIGPNNYSQNTDLIDNNGHEIYEGDYLRIVTIRKDGYKSYIGQVVFENGCFVIKDIERNIADSVLYSYNDPDVIRRDLYIIDKSEL